MKTNTIPAIALCAFLALGLAPAASAGDHDGYIYGTIETRSGNEYSGMLRWGTEEAFWDDLFNSSKAELPYLEKRAEQSRKRSRIKVLGITVGYRWEYDSTGRVLIARFGDIAEIVPRRGEEFELVMKSGRKFDLQGGSNDIGATISVWDDSLGKVEIKWDKIERIVFRPTPSSVRPEGRRLFGTVTTERSSFEGYIQWDSQECVSTDKLDGDTEDGEVSIEMGRIRSIEKRNRRGSWVELKDGRRLLLEDSNDVDSSIRGIFVEDERFGRVKISWDAFQRVDFKETNKSGRGYRDYKPAKPLQGTVTTYEGTKHSGRMVFDLDEEETWELLNGDLDDVEYYIPFGIIRRIVPDRGDTSRVVTRNGAEVVLEDGQDVSERNAGIMLLRDNGRETYVAWDEIKQIDFE